MIALAALVIGLAAESPDLCLDLVRGGKLEDSIRSCSASLEEGTRDCVVLFTVRGESYRRLGELDRAVADFSAAIDLDPKAVLAWENRGATLLEKGDADGVLRDFDRALALDPANVLAFYDRGLLLAEAGETDRALHDFTQAIRLEPGLAQAYLQRGPCCSKKGDCPRSVADFSAAIARRPDHAQAFHNRAVARTELGDLEGALEDAERAVALSPGNAPAVFNKAVVLLCRQEPVAAAQTLRTLIASVPDNEYLALLLAVATRMAGPGERDKARSVLGKVVRQPAEAGWIRAVSLLVLGAEGASADAVAARARADEDPLAPARASPRSPDGRADSRGHPVSRWDPCEVRRQGVS